MANQDPLVITLLQTAIKDKTLIVRLNNRVQDLEVLMAINDNEKQKLLVSTMQAEVQLAESKAEVDVLQQEKEFLEQQVRLLREERMELLQRGNAEPAPVINLVDSDMEEPNEPQAQPARGQPGRGRGRGRGRKRQNPQNEQVECKLSKQ